jgi:Glycosyl hydrolases family 16
MTVPREPTREISRQAFLRAAAGALAAGTVFGSVRATADPKTSGWPQPSGPSGGPFTLVLNEEFAGTSLNTSLWNDTASMWGNYLNGVTTLASNVSVNNGLTLTLSDASNGACIYTGPTGWGGGANPGFTYNEGIVEARIYFPGNGTGCYNWGAWWSTPLQADWPAYGENDIAECLGGMVQVHVLDNNHPGPGIGGENAGYVGNAYHTFTLQRTATNSIFWYDGNEIANISTVQNAATSPNFIVLNIGVGEGSPTMTGAAGALLVEYVRAWTVA